MNLLLRGFLSKPRLSGSSALALTTVGTNAVRLLSTIVLTRILSPDIYGITGLVMSVFYTINMITDIGLQAYVVRHERSDDDEFLDKVFTLHAMRGAVLTTVGVAIAWPVAELLGKPQVAAPLAVASLAFLLDSHVSLRQFTALRKGGVKRFALIDLISGVSQTLSAIIFALLSPTIWAIIASLFVASIARVWSSYALFSAGRHHYRLDRDVAADLWRFSRVVGTSSILTLVITQIDKIALGRLLTLPEFGTFVIAATLASAPTVFAFNYASTIVYPAISEAWRDRKTVAEAYYRCWGRFWYLYIFAAGSLAGLAEVIVKILYDDRYVRAADYLSILAVGTGFVIVTRAIESVQIATGHQRKAIEFNLIRLTWLGIGMVLSFALANPIILVAALGLVEIPVYFYGVFTMRWLVRVRWIREVGVLVVVTFGFVTGSGLSAAALNVLPIR